MIPPPHQILIFAAVLFMVLGATAGLSIWLTRDFFYQRGYHEGYREGWDMARFDTRMDEVTGYDAGAARDEAYGEPAEVYDHETEGL